MKASLISVRIADFLKDYPPFSSIPRETLIELANQGKVKFHEEDEIIFSKGQPREKWLLVIQQGKVSVIDEAGEEEELVDYRGKGDILGLQGVISEEPYLHTTRTKSEVILYCLPRSAFVEAVEHFPGARRYLAAYFSLSPAYLLEPESSVGETAALSNEPVTLRKGGLFEVGPPQVVAEDSLVTIGPERTVSEAAAKLQSKRVGCLAIVDSNGKPLGKLTDADLRDAVVAGSVLPNQRISQFMQNDFVMADPKENTGSLLIKLAKSGKNFLFVTEDGTANSKLIGLVAERNLFLYYGRFPSVIGAAISSAPNVSSLKQLRDRTEMLIMEFIDDRRTLPWLMEMTGVLNRKMAARLIELALIEMKDEGLGDPPVAFSWLMMGSGGRDELLIRSAVYHALVYEDPNANEVDLAERFFGVLADKVGDGLRKCGFLESTQGVLAQNEGWCLPLSKMKKKFANFIENPVDSHVYNARDAFDFQSVKENCPLEQKLLDEIRVLIKSNPNFIKHMAEDSLLNQPPTTIFQGYVVDKAGIEKEELEIKFHALLPLVDVGRVLALESGKPHPTATYKRLLQATDIVESEKEKQLLIEASNAFRVAQYARIREGIRKGTDGAVIIPRELDSEFRTLLVTTFRTILSTLEFTAKRYHLSVRK